MKLMLDTHVETIVADLIESGIDLDDIQVKQQGAFLRPKEILCLR